MCRRKDTCMVSLAKVRICLPTMNPMRLVRTKQKHVGNLKYGRIWGY